MTGDEFACPSLDGRSAFLRLRSDFAALRMTFAAGRVIWLLKLERRYRQDQLRVSAGYPDGGQWTDEGGGAGNTSYGRVRVAQARSGRDRPPILARFPEATQAQEARWAVSDAWARGAIARAQERIPGYKPRDSTQETIEGEINKNEADARDAEAALAAAGTQARPPPDTLSNVCRPNDNLVGTISKGAGRDVRAVTGTEFDQLLRDLTNGARETSPTDPKYQGVWYQRLDGTTIGVRRSDRHGLTIDIINTLGNDALPRALRIHKR